MNYRHAYHAGNFADCFKHALLIALLDFSRVSPTRVSCSIRMRAPDGMTLMPRRRDALPRRKPGYGVCWGRGRQFWSAILSL